MSNKFPKHWVSISLDEVNNYISNNINPSNFLNEKFELYSVPSYSDGEPEIIFGKEIGSSKQIVQPNDVLICKINPRINRVWRVYSKNNYRQIASTEWIVFRNVQLCAGFFQYYFTSQMFRKLITSDVTGVGGSLTRAQPKRVKSFSVPIPPFNEQQRIYERLDSLIKKAELGKEHLDRVPDILKRFRQSVLAEAVSGRLTEDWREKNDIGQTPIYVTLDETKSSTSYGTSSKSQKEGLVPVLRMGNIQDGKLDWTDLVYTSDENEIEKYKLNPGDVLFNRTNSPELVGKTAVYRGYKSAIYAGYLIRVICGESLLPDYLSYCLNSPYGREWCWNVKSDGVSQSNINAKKLGLFRFLLPSILEQKEIVARVESLFEYIDLLYDSYKDGYTQVEMLTSSLLAKAFQGKLVPQDPNDEPVDELLQRIKMDREIQQDIINQRKDNMNVDKKKTVNFFDNILDALANNSDGLTTSQLFVSLGYSLDANTDQLEEFYVDLRSLLDKKLIGKNRIGNEDWFSIN